MVEGSPHAKAAQYEFMQKKSNPSLLPLAKKLRKNMTAEEKHLWYDFLRDYPVKFIRQRVLGDYIVDFYCAKLKLVVEVDGAQHYDAKGRENDARRTEYLSGYGIKVIRVLNRDINTKFESVCQYIDKMVMDRTLPPQGGPPPLGKGEAE